MKIGFIYNSLLALFFLGCSSESPTMALINDSPDQSDIRVIKILSLGDSYTIGQSVCTSCKFPEQLKDSLALNYNDNTMFDLRVIAQTGWTTTALKNRIAVENPTSSNDLVTLLIGVNNQFQGLPFALYETEFQELVDIAISRADGDKTKVIVISIPDYAYTPFGQNNGDPNLTSMEIDQYNSFAQNYCAQNDISFVYVTDISRMGLDNPALVASDGLHPSELAYTQFVQRMLPLALEKIE